MPVGKLFLLAVPVIFFSACCPAQEVSLYKFPDFYNKDVVKAKPGRYDTIPAPVGDNKINSVKVPPGMKVILYENKNCTGASFELYSDMKNLRLINLVGKISSFKIETTTRNISQQFVTLDNINEALCPFTVQRGDREFDGHGPRMKCDVQLRIGDDGKALYADIYYWAQETTHDWSTTEGRWSKKVYEVFESNKRIVKIDMNERAVTEHISGSAGAEGEMGAVRPISNNPEFWNEMKRKYAGFTPNTWWKQTRTIYTSSLGGGFGNNTCYVIPPMQGRLVSKFYLVGDTGGPDISDDQNNCKDDTRVQKIEFNRVFVQIEQL